jgi:Tol biopolymer transport system component
LVPAVRIPVSWANLHLTGKLVFTAANEQQSNPTQIIQILDLASGVIKPILQTAGLSWIYYTSVSSADQEIVVSYEPVPGAGSPGRQALYVLPLDGSQVPQLLFNPPTANDLYLQAEWSPDSTSIYFVHSTALPQTAGQLYPTYEIYRMAYPNGQPERIAQYAFWPRVSGDSSRLVYISSDPMVGTNSIFLADADGSNAHEIPLQGSYVPAIIDAPMFSPDGKSILFSAPPPPQAEMPNWLDSLFGVTIAHAHTVPSEWWSAPINGGRVRQLTHIQSPILFASASPDGQWIASYSGNGLFVMKPDGTQLTVLIPDLGGIAGMVSWIP